ncbi:phosphatidate cytidylyltransferase [Iamia sp. SCSIO 61187]|uniref:phosphatidate cytidylyltransferase n=1 Tax=Iamia sp. SCSIO 61187 TaxID=2722752 RepID=UPI001C635331|nr:phosphatidate cytidylyltransferase [Iamia sp. SCSIO 61187]QYG92653.1 phosphatidate cytidylyltransferase [Iamia sp. SCSIO 61187]
MADDRRRDDARPGDPAEGVRIIGAEEAAEAIERGDVAERRGTHLPRYGDRPARPPAGPKPALRFPLGADDDAETPSLRPAKGQRFDPRPPPAWDEPDVPDDDDADPWPAESTWGEAAWDADEQADVVAWTRGETGAQPVVPPSDTPAEPELSWAEDFVDDDDPWDGSWDEPTGAVRWADDVGETADAAAGGDDGDDGPVPEAPVVIPEPVVDVRDEPSAAGAPFAPEPADDDWSAFGAVEEPPRPRRGLLGRLGLGSAAADAPEPAPTPDPPITPDPPTPPITPDPIEDLTGDEATDAMPSIPDPPAPPPSPPAGDDGDDAPEAGASLWAPGADDLEAAEGPPPPDADADAEADADADADAEPDDAEAAGLAAWGEPSWGIDEAATAEPPAEGASPLFTPDGGWADDDKVFDFGDEPSGQVELPHWTEPGTGELPRILAGDDDATSAPSGSTPAAHWRSHDGAWGHDGFDDLTDDDEVRVGAMDLDRPHEEELFDFDELDEVGSEPPEAPAPTVAPVGRRLAPARPVPEPGDHGGGAGRNLGIATAVGVGAAVLAGVLLYLGSAFVLVLVAAVLVVGMGEFQAAAQRAGYRPASLLGLAAAALYPLAVYWKGIEAYPLLAVVTVMAALAWHLVGADGDARVVESIGVTLFGVAWIAGLGSFAALLLAQSDGRGMFLTAVLAAVGYDVGGLIIGRTFGRRPLSGVSPNKTLEGLLGGIGLSFFAVVVVVGLFGIAPWDDIGDAALIGLLAMLAAPLGDICESLVKRDLGVKDMGNLLPEHGGLLDRFDGLLFVLPTVFYAAMLFELAPF